MEPKPGRAGDRSSGFIVFIRAGQMELQRKSALPSSLAGEGEVREIERGRGSIADPDKNKLFS